MIELALSLAAAATRLSNPNPRVGCVIVSPQGTPIGQGHTQAAGGPHAEVVALRDALAAGHDVTGCTAYVTLEPCAHQGRTGPCCDALIAAGIAKVVASIEDPNPLVAGRGFARLRAAGIEVVVGPGAAESRELNIGFFSRMVRGQPWVRAKMAASLDAITALPDGTSQWITAEPARRDGHAWRARACAVLTGIGTVLQDDPRLDVRMVDTPRQPHLVVVDRNLALPPGAKLWQPRRQVWVYTAQPAHGPTVQRLLDLGATVTSLPDAAGKVDLRAMLQDLARREVNELHVEAGARLTGALLRQDLLDELVLYLAPVLLGQGHGLTDLGPVAELAQGRQLDIRSHEVVGPDLRIVARFRGRDSF